ncbi:MAG TPA: glucose-6-phosphate dehydrogenase assembly protein OpcA [Streptosporangiaceae bacterium]|jgi:glucose-6-phosphate dehydrogenase assembly protein OpcA|nr:glucose-6-phosphate dehydrogenase assembly protein OpcA [Streptosporangiaceae bacterium]
MTIDLTDTSTGAIYEALTEARRRLGGPAMGMVLTLVVETNEAAQYDAMRAANQAGREHPSRVIGVITRRPKAESRLDAEIRVGETGPGETILLRMYGPLGQHADSVVAPLLVPDVPVVTWWPGQAPNVPSESPLGALAQRRVTDSAADQAPQGVLAALADAYKPGDTDMSWTRVTPWRTLLAATFDVPYPPLIRGAVLAEQGNPSGDVLAAWLSVKLGIPVRRGVSGGPGITDVSFDTEAGQIGISRPDGRTATLSRTGEPDRRVALHRRDLAELLAEELRRLDPDDVYAESLWWLFSEARFDDDVSTGSFTLADPATADRPGTAGNGGTDEGQRDSGGPADGEPAGSGSSPEPDQPAGEDALDPGQGQTGVETEEEIAGQ